MRHTACCLVFVATLVCRAQPVPDFKALYQAQQWFRLRDAVVNTWNAPPFYKAVIDAAFHHDDAADSALRRVMHSVPGSWESDEAQRILEAHRGIEGVFRKPMPALRLLNRAPAKIWYSNAHDSHMQIPASINAKPVLFAIDTGASGSLISKSAAKWLGLSMIKVTGEGGDGWSGKPFAFDYIGIARKLVIGATEFRDVAFVVVPDDHLFADWSIGEQGVIGIPILWMLRTIRWNSNGEFETGFPSERQDLRKANLCFDEYRLVAEVGYRDAQLIFSVDTGADTTILYVRFRDEFPALAASGQKQTRQGRGISGVVNNDEVIALSPQNFRIGTFPLALADPAVYLNPGIGVGHHGNLGWRQLSQARTVTFDFSAMTLTLEGSH